MSFVPYIKQVSRAAFFHQNNIMKIRNILSQDVADKLVHASVQDWIILPPGLPNKSLKGLQLIQNAAARVLTATTRSF